jgi:hypothetical protein
MSSRYTAYILICRVPASWLTVLLNISLIGPKGHVGYERGSCEMATRASYPGLEIIAKLATVLEVEPTELLRGRPGAATGPVTSRKLRRCVGTALRLRGFVTLRLA